MNNYAGLMDGDATMRAAQQTLREIQKAREALDTTPAGKGASMLCVTTSLGSYPTMSPAAFAVVPEECDAEDDEGAAATYTDNTDSTFFAINLGTNVPPQGSRIIVHAVGGRWLFRWS